MAALDQKTSKIQLDIEDLDADPPRLNTQLLKRRAALLKALNLTDADIINQQQATLIRLERAALVTQQTVINDKRKVVQDKLNTDLATLLTVVDVINRPGRPEWIQQLPNQRISAGVPVLTPKLIIDAGIKTGIQRHRLAFTANQIRHRDAAAAKATKRAAQKQLDDAVLTFTSSSFRTAIQTAVRTAVSRRPARRPTKPRKAPTTTGAPPSSRRRRRPRPATQSAPQPRRTAPAQVPHPAARRARIASENAHGRSRSTRSSGPSALSRYPLRHTDARAVRAARTGVQRI